MKSKLRCLPGCCCCCYFFCCHRSCRAPASSAVHQADSVNPALSASSPDVKQTESFKATLLVPGDAKPPPPNAPLLNGMTREGKRSKRRGNMIRASSNNVMLFGYLGNVKGKKSTDTGNDVLGYLPKTAKELSEEASANKMAAEENEAVSKELTAEENVEVVVPKELSAEANASKVAAKEIVVAWQVQLERLDAETLKEMGNEEYKNGRYVEAEALYERAIFKDPKKASYWSNKAAALLGVGKLLEAVGDCRAAVRIDPLYCRAHYRLATLYLRLGDADKAIIHYKLSREEASLDDISSAQALQTHLAMSDEARKHKNWFALLKLTQGAISAGADSAPQVFASQAEALLNLHRYEEADTVLASSPKFDVDGSTKFFGAAGTAYHLAVRARVDIATGRFEDAVLAAEMAAQLDPSDRDLSSLAQKALVVASAQLKGNALFNDSKFSEACRAYTDGLDQDRHNAILLCNRAACQFKLGQWERAIEDCNAVLKFLPSYSKARLRRAECNAKMERWGAAIQDYEILLRQMPGDEDVIEALFEAHAQFKKNPGEGVKDSKNDAGLHFIE